MGLTHRFTGRTKRIGLTQRRWERRGKGAVKNLKEAVDLYLDNAKELGIIDDTKESLTTKEKYTAHLEASF